MSACCHDVARLIFAMGLAAIAYGAVFGFLPRSADTVKTMVDCVAKTPKNFISCVKGNGGSNGVKNPLLINILFIVMVTFGCVFLVLAIVFIILNCCCCHGSSCLAILENIMLGLALPALLDGVCYLGSVLLLNINAIKSNELAKNALNIAGTYSGYVGVSLAAAWLLTCLIGPVMTRNNSTCLKIVCMIVGLAVAAGVYCAVVLVDPKKVPNLNNSTTNGTTTPTGIKERLYPALIIAAFVAADYVLMFLLCTCITSGGCCGKSD
ncbi:Hypothetical protein GLP15_3847 [Giardia lamblia P15]|uniref:Uncharacterized protein n=1 Tax=Giardia intestinalis (strain P15) TaxID=658858 RepID=E1F1C3_GIAIA|nr:Hypothetical protein GLP15_3847 [Giardia lamblia P15]